MGAFWQYFLDFFGLGWAFHRVAGQPVVAGRVRAAGEVRRASRVRGR